MTHLLADLKIIASDTFAEIFPLIKKLVQDLEAGLLPIAETVLTGAVAGTPWTTLITSFIAAAEKEGKTIAAQDAATVLSTAEANLAAKGTPAAVTTASTPTATAS